MRPYCLGEPPMPTKQSKRKKGSVLGQCLVVSVIGKPGSAGRQNADKVLKNIIKPALSLQSLRYTVYRIDELGWAGSITDALVEKLRSVSLVIADLTGLNPNVFYEVGVRHAWNLPVVQIAKAGTRLPFDVQDMNTVSYGDVDLPTHCQKAQREIRRQVRNLRMGLGKAPIFERNLRALAKPGKEAAERRIIFDVVRTAVGDLIASLLRVRHEAMREIEKTRPDALQALADLARRPFETLADKWYVFEGIEERLEIPGLKRILDRGQGLIDEWIELAEAWHTTRASRPAFEEAQEKLNTIATRARSIRRALQKMVS